MFLTQMVSMVNITTAVCAVSMLVFLSSSKQNNTEVLTWPEYHCSRIIYTWNKRQIRKVNAPCDMNAVRQNLCGNTPLKQYLRKLGGMYLLHHSCLKCFGTAETCGMNYLHNAVEQRETEREEENFREMLNPVIERCLLFCCFRPFEAALFHAIRGADGSVMKCGGAVPTSARNACGSAFQPNTNNAATDDADEN